MYIGLGLQTPRGSGTKADVNSGGFDADQGIAGVSKKPNRHILEHDRKCQIELNLVILEDKLTDQGFNAEEIAMKLAKARTTLEATAAAKDTGSCSL